MRLALSGLALALLAQSGAAQEFRITRAEVDFEEGVSFEGLTRYAWKPSQDPGSDPTDHATLVFEIERALGDAGLQKAASASEAQLLVRYYTSFERRVRSTPTQERAIEPSNQRTSVGFSRAMEGTLVIELYRPSDDRRIWRGRISDVTGKKRFSDEQVRRAVDLIVSEYPPQPEGGVAGPPR